ncbi:uncharacterized protein [Argopecten irradians]|uniref:uncharacterized protein n=1 Tax=Argopecten irradians TaxID=31199 RepID=UPI0037117730
MAVLRLFFVLGCLLVFQRTESKRILLSDDDLYLETIQLDHLHPQIRPKRSTDDFAFPSEFMFHFLLQGKQLEIPLYRKDFSRIPTKRSDSKFSRTKMHRSVMTHAIYHNIDKDTSITMRCRDLTSASCELYGMFTHDNEAYQIQPSGDGIYSPYEISKLDLRNRRFIDVHGDVGAAMKRIQDSKKFQTFGKEQLTKSRRKRAVDTTYVGEMVIWLDLSIWSRIEAVSGAETADADAETFAISVMNDADTRVRNMDVQYQEQGGTVSFSCSLMMVHLEICKTASACTWSEGAVSNGVITSTDNYMGTTVLGAALGLENSAGLANTYDFMNFLTAYTVVDSTGLTGCGAIFRRDLMCRVVPAARTSVTMIKDGGGGFNTAHFFAMHVGAEGDNNSPLCDNADQFASSFQWDRASMSSSKAVNPWRWSDCALDQISQTILEDPSYTACLLDRNFDEALYDEYQSQGGLGMSTDADDQCVWAFGVGSTFCGTQNEAVCYNGLDCTTPGTGTCDQVVYALEGSMCNDPGNEKAVSNRSVV